jgi:hypothetical protein
MNSIDKAIDWTFYATAGWTSYLGIALSEGEYHRAKRYAYLDGEFHLLFKRNVFPRTQSYLSDLLQERKEKDEHAAVSDV